MAIEKAFAIEAAPALIWDALWAELAAADPARFNVDRSHRPESLALDVNLGGLPARITYRIVQREAFCEVSATLEPLSSRYFWLQLLTFGKLRIQYELALTQGLANLKASVEGAAGD